MKPDALKRRADQIGRRLDRADDEFQQEDADQLAHLEQQVLTLVAENQRLRDRVDALDPAAPSLCKQCRCPECQGREGMTEDAKVAAIRALFEGAGERDAEAAAELDGYRQGAKARRLEQLGVEEPETEPVVLEDAAATEVVDALESAAAPDTTPLEPPPTPIDPVVDVVPDAGVGYGFSGLDAAQSGGTHPSEYGRGNAPPA